MLMASPEVLWLTLPLPAAEASSRGKAGGGEAPLLQHAVPLSPMRSDCAS